MSGTFTSILDLYNNIINFKYNTEFIILYDNFLNIIKFKKYFVNLQNINFIHINNLENLKFNTLILNTNTYKHIQKYSINYGNIILLDTSTLFEDFMCNNSLLIHKIAGLKNKVILGNRFNSKYFSNEYCIYYHKFNKDRLVKLKEIEEVNESLSYLEYKKTKYKDINPFSYKKYCYIRWHKFNNIYYENIGKMIFEFKYLNKAVYYSSKNKMLNDGLTEYLGLFNIDDDVDQNIILDINKFEDLLFLNEDDIIFNFLE